MKEENILFTRSVMFWPVKQRIAIWTKDTTAIPYPAGKSSYRKRANLYQHSQADGWKLFKIPYHKLGVNRNSYWECETWRNEKRSPIPHLSAGFYVTAGYLMKTFNEKFTKYMKSAALLFHVQYLYEDFCSFSTRFLFIYFPNLHSIGQFIEFHFRKLWCSGNCITDQSNHS